MKDNFSLQAELYAKFRPKYPSDLIQFVLSLVENHENAWDCATGNGQVAGAIAEHFNAVFATDASQKQLDNAIQQENIFYSRSAAEVTDFEDNTFDLITVAQAAHWFQLPEFYKEVKRVARKNAVLAIWGYSLFSISPEIDDIISDFYQNIIGPYWDAERRLVDNGYRDLHFPFEAIPTPEFHISFECTLRELEGYLNTWSSVQKYIAENKFNPINELIGKIEPHWRLERRKISFPIFMKVTKIS
jgi:SAM-dependent methyltransferase